MASSDEGTSSGSEYQVFLSFRGPDTRAGFTNCLFHSLTDVGICVFLDDEEVRVGERIDGSLRRGIDNSKIYIPIFSRTYASSQWCLRELVQIVANTSESEGEKKILPIFFDVEPDDVKLKTPLYRDALLNLEREKNLSTERVDAWRKALIEVDAIKGWEVKKYKGYGDVIKLVVEEVLKKLKTKHRLVTEHLVEIDDRVMAVIELLDVDSGGVRIIKIHGMGGIGKTTLAKIVFNRLSSHFGKCCCFLEDVREKSRTCGLVGLQKKLLSEIGHPAGIQSIDEIDYGTKRTREALRDKKIFIVLDDVANSKQVEQLVGRSALYSGSRILITTRNKDVLPIIGPNCLILEYEMEVMSSDCALKLFSRHAFKEDSPWDDYKDLSREMVSATGGLPLAIEVIGSFLFDKRQQAKWKETLLKLGKTPFDDVFGKLKISYDDLSEEQRQIFLDIACFFIGEHKTYPFYMWEDLRLLPYTGVDVLMSMSLVKIKENKFLMHDQVRDLGREIVRQENPMNPGERSRIWTTEDVLIAIRTKEIKKNVQALNLDLDSEHKVVIRSEDIGRFPELRYLKLNGGTFKGELANSLTNLRWIVWSNPPHLFSKPAITGLKNVVILEFSENSNIDDSKLQSLIKVARRLKVLSLEGCRSIKRLLDFSGCLNLERLNFYGCSNLRKIGGSIGKLESLIDLEIVYCGLKDFPEEIGNLINLELFSIWQCPLEKLPDSIWKLKSLRELHFNNFCSRLNSKKSWELPSAIMPGNLEMIQIHSLGLKGRLPLAIGRLPFLRRLYLSFTGISEVPETISTLPCLEMLWLSCCNAIQELPTLPTSLNNLQVSSESLRIIPDLSNLTNLVSLNLAKGSSWRQEGKTYIGDLGWIGMLCKLNKLDTNLLSIPAPSELAFFSQLKELVLSGLDLETIDHHPVCLLYSRLEFNSAGWPFSQSENLSRLSLSLRQMQEIQLNGLQLQNLTELKLTSSETLLRFGLSDMRKLKSVEVRHCPKLVEIQFAGVFESLEELTLQNCVSLGRLAYMGDVESANELIIEEGRLILLSRVLNKLREFYIFEFPRILQIQVLGTSELSNIIIDRCHHLRSVCGLPNSKKLKFIQLRCCDELRVVEGLDEFEFLKYLTIIMCPSLKGFINASTTKLPNDCSMHVDFYGGKFAGARTTFRGSVQSYKNSMAREEEAERNESVRWEAHVLGCISKIFFSLCGNSHRAE